MHGFRTSLAHRIAQETTCSGSLKSLGRYKRVKVTFSMSAQLDFMYVTDTSNDSVIATLNMKERVSSSHTVQCQGRSKLPQRCYSSRAIQRFLIVGLRRMERIRRTVKGSAVYSKWPAGASTPTQRAAEYLRRISALTEAERVYGNTYSLRAGRRTFLVDHKFVRVMGRKGKSTCFSVAADIDMLTDEVIACVLLQLKNNPRLFKKWRKQPGCTFKASGKMFEGSLRIPA